MKFFKKKSVVGWKEGEHETFSVNTTLDQSIQALEYASARAMKKKSSEDMTAAAHGWMRLTETIHTITMVAQQQAEQQAEVNKTRPATDSFGFRAPEQPGAPVAPDEPRAEEEDVD